jgi:hypothetical protein
LWNGWHRNNRRNASQPPRASPKRSIASRAYALQDGVYRQVGGRNGLIDSR